MFRVLTNEQTATFKIIDDVYKIRIQRRADNKSCITVFQIFIDKEDSLVMNKYGQLKTIAEKEIQVYQALEDFYPVILVEDIDNERN